MLRIAYISEPYLGGTFTFFQHLRPELAAHGMDLRCIPNIPASQVRRSSFREIEGIDAVELTDSLRESTGLLIDHLRGGDYPIVLTLPSCGPLSANLPRYLPAGFRCAVRVPMMTRGAYAPTAAVEPYVDKVVCVSDRVRDDLVGAYDMPAGKMEVIYNSVSLHEFPERRQERTENGVFRLLYVGRLSDADKGVMLLPSMLGRMKGRLAEVGLLVVGQGPDEARLRRAFDRAGLAHRVSMMGGLPHIELRKVYYEADCFVLTSRFEGCPNALVEAMAAGCVPVASRIRGSVDKIVEHGISGLLFRVGDAGAMAGEVLRLLDDAELWQRLSRGGRQRVAERFTVKQMAASYAQVFRQMLESPPTRATPLRLEGYTVPKAMKPTWRTRVPPPIKNMIRTWAERFGRSV